MAKKIDSSIDADADVDDNDNDNGKKIITGGFTFRFYTSRWRFNKFQMRFVTGLIKDTNRYTDRNLTFSPERR